MSLHVLFVFQSLPLLGSFIKHTEDLPRSGTVNTEYPPAATTRKNKHLFHLVLTGNFFLGLSRKIVREKPH